MLGFNRILLATDFSDSATAVLLYAAALTRLSHATLQVLHVIDTRVAALPRWTDVFRSTEAFAAKAATETAALQELLAHPALAGLPVEQLVRQGHPADSIIDPDFSVPSSQPGIMRVSAPYPMKAMCSQRVISFPHPHPFSAC